MIWDDDNNWCYKKNEQDLGWGDRNRIMIGWKKQYIGTFLFFLFLEQVVLMWN